MVVLPGRQAEVQGGRRCAGRVHVSLVDNSDTQHTCRDGHVDDGRRSAASRATTTGPTPPAGTGTDEFTWTLDVPADGTYTAYVKYPQVTGAATDAKYALTHGGRHDHGRDGGPDRGHRDLGQRSARTPSTQGNEPVTLFRPPRGTVVADAREAGARQRRRHGHRAHAFAYAYDANGNLTWINDTSSGAKVDDYTVTYTGLNQVEKVTEALAGQEKKTTTLHLRRATASRRRSRTPTSSSPVHLRPARAGRDGVGRQDGHGAVAEGDSYTYADRGAEAERDQGQRQHRRLQVLPGRCAEVAGEKKPDGTLVASHTYAYDRTATGRRTSATKMNADDHAAYLDSTTTTPTTRSTGSRSRSKTGNGAGTETYVHDDNANIISQTVKGTRRRTPTTATGCCPRRRAARRRRTTTTRSGARSR